MIGRRLALKGLLAMTGDGLRRPVNAPRGQATPPGVQPGVSNGVQFARQVIVFGPTGQISGVFVYAPGTMPGPGNIPIAAVTADSTDPYGNPAQPQISSYDSSTTQLAALGNGSVILGYGSSSITALSITPAGDIELLALRDLIFGSPVQPFSTSDPASAGTSETWHSVSLTGAPAGTSGSCRVKISPLANFAIFDIEISFTALGAQGTYTIGSLPSAAYYPLTPRHYAAGLAGTATGSPQARVLIPASGAVQLVDIPAGASGFGCTALYPLD